MSLSRVPLWSAALTGLFAFPLSAMCPIDLPAEFNGAAAYGAGDLPEVETRGTADEGGRVAVGETTRFNLGSVNKMMTAVAIGQLVEQGRMSFDDPVGRHLEGLPPDVAALRIDQLLSHTAGLSLFLRPDLEQAINTAPDARSLVPLVVAEPREEPGPFRYSNAGFVLAGAVVEAVSGLSYAEYLTRNIYPAAGISPQPVRWQPGDAEGVDPESPEFARSVSRLKVFPAGSLVLSAPDLWRFGRALVTGRLIKPETLEAMMSGGIELRPAKDDWPASRYGFGLSVTGAGAGRTISHTGGAPGVDAALRVDLASGRTVAVLSNRSGTEELNASDIAKVIMSATASGQCGDDVQDQGAG